MENNNEKRMAGCWEILHALHIGDKDNRVTEEEIKTLVRESADRAKRSAIYVRLLHR